MLALNLQAGHPAALSRARRVEALAETALHIASAYAADGRLEGALTLVEAVLRDPDLPTDRPELLARLKARRALLLSAHAELGHVDLAATRAALQAALALALEVGDEASAADIRAALHQLPRFV